MLLAMDRLKEMRQRNKNQEIYTKPSPKSPKTSGMTLGEFAGSGRGVRIYSDVLGEEMIFAADNAHIPPEETRPVYRARELVVILSEEGGMSADGLRLLHEVKTRFNSEVLTEEGVNNA